jgi:hypothetical protein
MGASLAEIKDKVSTAIKAVADPPPPKDTTIVEIGKLRNSGITILFKEKEVVDWLQDATAELAFMAGIAQDAIIRQHQFTILVPRVPLTFDPAIESHLREVEENNDMPARTLCRARWIKPVNRRSPEQRAAHAAFTLRDINITNAFIRDGIYVCGMRLRPSRLKHEPMQCMKCRRWGHFAHSCPANDDTCGTCGEAHRTSVCGNKDKLHCVSCKADTHVSWDRECPEFLRRCAQLDENYPENNLPYFPTDEEWMLMPRPNRIPITDRFPPRYAVGNTSQPSKNNRDPPTRSINRQPKHTAPKPAADQRTMEQFLGIPRTGRENNPNDVNVRFADANFNPHSDRPNFYNEGSQIDTSGWT